ncbi:MAG: hypothetical protein NVS9B15_03280 [Acidobacteriaceae bacterium]
MVFGPERCESKRSVEFRQLTPCGSERSATSIDGQARAVVGEILTEKRSTIARESCGDDGEFICTILNQKDVGAFAASEVVGQGSIPGE